MKDFYKIKIRESFLVVVVVNSLPSPRMRDMMCNDKPVFITLIVQQILSARDSARRTDVPNSSPAEDLQYKFGMSIGRVLGLTRGMGRSNTG